MTALDSDELRAVVGANHHRLAVALEQTLQMLHHPSCINQPGNLRVSGDPGEFIDYIQNSGRSTIEGPDRHEIVGPDVDRFEHRRRRVLIGPDGLLAMLVVSGKNRIARFFDWDP